MFRVIQEGDYARDGLNFYWARGPAFKLKIGVNVWRLRIRNPKYGKPIIFNHYFMPRFRDEETSVETTVGGEPEDWHYIEEEWVYTPNSTGLKPF